MALDDQLAALAAGELDEETARALRARAAADPALARQLARHEQLQRLLAAWDAPPMSEDAVQRLDARLDEALAELDDGPLVERTPGAAPLQAVPRPERVQDTSGVVDLGRARQRRSTPPTGRSATQGAGGRSSSWPSWTAGAAVAAALTAIVGAGIVIGGLPGGDGLDMLAGGSDDSTAEEAADATGEGDFSGSSAESAPAQESADQGLAGDESADGDDMAAMEDSAPASAPARRSGVAVAEGELLTLLEPVREESGAADDGAATSQGQSCVDEALRRDTAQADDRDVTLLADGTYAGRAAAFVVVRTQQDDGPDLVEVLAYDPDDCSLLARDQTTR